MKDKTILIILGIILLIVIGKFGLSPIFSTINPNPCLRNTVREDAWVDFEREDYKRDNFGDGSLDLEGYEPDNEIEKVVYLKFKIPENVINAVKTGIPLDEAVIDIHIHRVRDSGDITIYGVSNDWDEYTLNYYNRPKKENVIIKSSIENWDEYSWVSLIGFGDYIEKRINEGEKEISIAIFPLESPNEVESIDLKIKDRKGWETTNCVDGRYVSSYAPSLRIYYTPPECTYEEEKCEGLIWYTCGEDGEWEEEGKIVGKCGYYTQPLQLAKNQLIAMECFNPPETITKESTRYPTIIFGGGIMPPLILDADTNKVSTDLSIYEDLEKGESLTIPENQVWCLFYVIENAYSLPTICQAVDVDTGECTNVELGIVTVCSNGQLDPKSGLCVIQSEELCEKGYYDTELKKCIYHPPIIEICEKGGDYNPNTEQCEYYPEKEFVCEDGFVYNNDTNKCEFSPDLEYICEGQLVMVGGMPTCQIEPEEKVVCPTGFEYDENEDKCIKYPDVWDKDVSMEDIWEQYKIWIIVGFIILVLLLFIGGRRR